MRFSALFQRSVISVQRLVIIFFLLSIFYFLSSATVSAQSYNDQSTNTYNQTNSYTTPNTTSDVPKNLHFYTQNVMIEVMSSMICQLSGTDPTNPNQPCLGIDSKTGKIGFDQKNSGGVIGVMGKFIGDLYVLPIHTGDYMNYLASNFGVTKTYAATTPCDPTKNGIGFCGLSPFATVWSSFRDVVYLFFVIIFVLIGLAIMLRMKIDPRTVMTVENQIPKIITNIILVTLSFAIAGFLIDMMYVTIYTTTNMISSAGGGDQSAKIVQSPDVFNVAGVIGDSWGGTGIVTPAAAMIGQSFQDTTGGTLVGDFINTAAAFYLGSLVVNLPDIARYKIPGKLKVLASKLKFLKITVSEADKAKAAESWFSKLPQIGGVIGATIAVSGMALTALMAHWTFDFISNFIYFLIVSLILYLAMIWALFRLWMALFSAYISILFHVVLAPFMIFFGVIPGSSIGFGSWIRGMVSNLLAFPVAMIMFQLGGVFIHISGGEDPIFTPPLIGNTNTVGSMGSLIGLAVIFMTPQVVKMMQELFKSEGFKYASAVGQAVGVGQSMVSGTGTAIYSPYGALHNFGRFREEGGLAGLFSAEARARARARYGNNPQVDLPKKNG